MRSMRRVLAVAVLAFVIVGVWAVPAFAHAVLEGTSPGAGATVAHSPKAITLTFGEPVEATLGAIRVFDSRAERVDVGAPEHPGGKGSEVSVSTPTLADGTYVVTWRVISADSHPVRGAFTFTVGTSATTTKQAQGLAARLLTDEGGSAAVGVLFAIAWFGAFAGLAVLLGAAAFLAYVWRTGRADRRARRILWIAWASALGFTLAGFALQGPYAAALGPVKALDPKLWADVWHTRFGHVYLGRVVLLLLALPLIRLLLPRRGPVIEHPLPRWWPYVAGVLGLALAATPGLAGHASQGPLVPLAMPADTLHIAGVGIWLGGLVVLFAALMPRVDEATLRDVVPRYSKYALVAMGVIVVTGVFQAFRQVDRLGALLDTDYGRLLLIKIVVFLGLMVVAAMSRDIVNRRWRIPEDLLVTPVPVGALATSGPAAPGGGFGGGGAVGTLAVGGGGEDGRDGDEDDDEEYPEGYVLDEPTAERRLRRSLLLEVLISIVILAVTALLVNSAPARGLDTGPYIGTLNAKQVSFNVTIDPASRGANVMHLYTLTPSGAVSDPVDVTAEMSQSANNIAPIKVNLIRLGPGHYTSSGFTVPFAGDWQLTVKAVVNQVDEASATRDRPDPLVATKRLEHHDPQAGGRRRHRDGGRRVGGRARVRARRDRARRSGRRGRRGLDDAARAERGDQRRHREGRAGLPRVARARHRDADGRQRLDRERAEEPLGCSHGRHLDRRPAHGESGGRVPAAPRHDPGQRQDRPVQGTADVQQQHRGPLDRGHAGRRRRARAPGAGAHRGGAQPVDDDAATPSAPATATKSSSDDGLSTGAIVAIAVGVVIVLALLGFILSRTRRNMRSPTD